MSDWFENVERFIAFGAHHDDVDLRCGGTFARLTREGRSGCYAVVVENGYTHAGYDVTDRATAVATREDECNRGAEAIGADRVEFMRYKSYYLETPAARSRIIPAFTDRDALDAELADVLFSNRPPIAAAVYSPEWWEPILDLMRDIRPQLILTHTPDDRHIDHYCTSNIITRLVEEYNAESGESAQLLYWEPGSAGVVASFLPDTYVALDEADVAAKQRALDGFVSQFPRENIENFAAERTAFYGGLCGVPSAEGFLRGTWPVDPPWQGPPGWAKEIAARRADIRVWQLDGSLTEPGN